MNQAVQSYHRGVIYAILGGILLSMGGLIVRLIEHADAWQILFYRSLAFFFTVLLFMVIRDRSSVLQRFRALRRTDGIVSLALSSGFIFYVLSLYHTSVANTVMLLSTGPFLAAILAWVVLREHVSGVTWLSIAIAVSGVVYMVSGGLTVGDQEGMFYAFLAVLSFAVMIVTLRQAGSRDMIAATALAGLLSAAVCLFFFTEFSISTWDFFMAALMGSVQVGFGFILITLASRSVPAAQVPLLTLGETALAPLWVWLWVSETPDLRTLIGGAVVIFALVFQGTLGVRQQNA